MKISKYPKRALRYAADSFNFLLLALYFTDDTHYVLTSDERRRRHAAR